MSDIQFQARVERRDRLVREVDSLQKLFRTGTAPAGSETRMVELKTAVERANQEIADLEAVEERRDEIAELAERPEHREAGAAFHEPATRQRRATPLDEDRDSALRAIEQRHEVIDAGSGDRLVDLIHRDKLGVDARYIRAISTEAYERAFAKRVLNPQGAMQELEPDEVEAMRNVARAMEERAHLAIGASDTGGYAVPIALDPTIILINDGQVNPWRQLATVKSISSSEWKGVTSAGVSAAFVPEATEAGDDSPRLDQPVIHPERAQAFAPFSIEVGMDWAGIVDELGKLFRDAKDTLEAEKFLTGAGSSRREPEGIVTGLASGSRLATARASALGISDVYAVQEALAPRYQPRAVWVSSNPIANVIYRMVAGGNTTEPPLFDPTRTRLLGRPWYEASDMDAAVADRASVLLYGDIAAGFRIVDRIGLTVELIPHLFGTARNFPTGERGLYMYWRTSSGIVNDDALALQTIRAA